MNDDFARNVAVALWVFGWGLCTAVTAGLAVQSYLAPPAEIYAKERDPIPASPRAVIVSPSTPAVPPVEQSGAIASVTKPNIVLVRMQVGSW